MLFCGPGGPGGDPIPAMPLSVFIPFTQEDERKIKVSSFQRNRDDVIVFFLLFFFRTDIFLFFALIEKNT